MVAGVTVDGAEQRLRDFDHLKRSFVNTEIEYWDRHRSEYVSAYRWPDGRPPAQDIIPVVFW